MGGENQTTFPCPECGSRGGWHGGKCSVGDIFIQTSKEKLDRLIEIAKSHKMTPAERREQRISFVFGMLPSRSTVTKDDVRRMMEEQGYV